MTTFARRTTPLLLALLLLAAAPRAEAAQAGPSRPFGLGLILGAPTGLSAKLFLDRKHALDFALGFGWLTGTHLHIHADYLFHFPLTRTRHFDLPFYVGVGGRFAFWLDEGDHGYWGKRTDEYHRFDMVVRVPLGVAFHLKKVPLDPFVELVPGLGIFPGVGFTIDAGVGVRYYF